jgi:hypothetical protein
VPLAVFALARLVDAVFILVASRHQIALGPSTIPELYVHQDLPADPGYLGIITNWDGQWYRLIASDGYRSVAAGQVATHVTSWAWAFPPLFPLLVGLVMKLGLSFAVAASVVSCAAGAAAAVLLYRLLDETGGARVATYGVFLFSCFVSAPLLQAAYSESLALLLLLWAILLVRRRSYWLALAPTVLLSFTRLITPVLGVVVVVAILARVRSEGWAGLTRRQRWGAGVLAGYAVLGAAAWPTLASRLMGEGARFNRATMQATTTGLGWFGEAWTQLGAAGVLLVLGLLAVPVVAGLTSRGSLWGTELRAWSVAYPAYVLALTPITGGVLRYALLSPTLGLLVVSPRLLARRPRAQLVVVLVAVACGLATQWLFVRHMLVIDAHPLMP